MQLRLSTRKRTWVWSARRGTALWGIVLLVWLAPGTFLGAAEERVTLRFTEPMTAMINARAWDDTHHLWHKGAPDELYFDGVHRFLLVRFPGSAEAIHARLQEGYQIEAVRLVLSWQKQEWERVEGYADRQWSLVREGHPPAHWHARVHALLRPWADDPEYGPTWNAYLNGAGYWRLGGARSPGSDRLPESLGRIGLWQEQPTGDLEVTRLLTTEALGAALPGRLRALESQGFLVQKDEISNPEYGSYAGSTGAARVWIEKPELVVVLAAAPEAPRPGPLPPAVSLSELAHQLAEAGGDGQPTTRVPDRLAELSRQVIEARRRQMPAWMWERVEEVKRIPAGPGYDPWFQRLVHALDSGDRQQYLATVDDILSRPPGWSQGHQRIEFSLPLYLYGDLLPEVVHYHLRLDYEAALPQPLEPYKLWAIASMGTLNHMANARPTWLLGAQLTGQTGIVEAAQYGLSLLNRQMVYSDGFSSEHGDSYYRGITLAPLQAAAKFAEDPFIRLKASLMVEKLLFEDISTYHPGLRHRVSRISRRAGGLHQLLLAQDVPEAALHTLSREGVLLHQEVPGDKPEVHGMPVFDLANTPPARVALMAPWGREWETNGIDRKPLPFRTVSSARLFGWTKEPVHAMTYMGHNYAIGTEQLPNYSFVPAFAAWRREARPVTSLEDFGIMLLQGRLNEEPVSAMDKTPFGILQHDNKVLWAVKTVERKFVREGHGNLPKDVDKGLTSFKAVVGLVAYGPEEAREVYVNGDRTTDFPATARFGDLITIKEGVSYLGLIPLSATDLGRRAEVVLRREHPFLTLEAYVMQREAPVLSDDDATWAQLEDATAAWALEFGDEAAYGSFAAFQQHMNGARTSSRWDAKGRVLHVSYVTGEDTLEMGFRTDWARDVDLWHDQREFSQVFAYQRVNGQWPWPDPGVALDNPLGQMGKAGLLEKGGARLRTLEGQMALLRVDSLSGTYEGVNPFVEPTPFELEAPEGAVVHSEGPLGMARVTMRPRESRLWVDYARPSAASTRALDKLRRERPEFFPRGLQVRQAREQSARALLVRGLGDRPVVILNGQTLSGPFGRVKVDGEDYIRVPITG